MIRFDAAFMHELWIALKNTLKKNDLAAVVAARGFT